MTRIVYFSFLIVQCLGSKTYNELRIPSVSELETSPGSLGNIGNNAPIISKLPLGSSDLGGIKKLGDVPDTDKAEIIGDDHKINNYGNYHKKHYDIDEEKYIERPCHVFDTYCIRKFFAEHSLCKECEGPVPDPLFRPQSTIYLPRINLTLTAIDVLYSGLNGRVDEFYINKKTDKLVLSIQFKNMTFYAKDTYYRFHRRGKEPIVTVDYLYFNYKSVISTIIIPYIKDLQLQKSEVFAYTDDGQPSFSIGPKAFHSKDPTVQLARKQLVSEIRTDAQEAQLTEGAYYTATYIQYSICDFGYKIL